MSAQELGGILREQGHSGCVEHDREAMALDAWYRRQHRRSADAFNLGAAYQTIPALRDLDQAEHWYQRSLELRGDKAPIRRARSLGQLGGVALERFNDAIEAREPVEVLVRHLNDAARRYQEALPLFPADDVADLAVTHGQLGNVYRHAGDIARAFDHYQRSIKYEMARGNRFGAGVARLNIAVMLATARPADALLFAQAALADYDSYGGGAEKQAETARAPHRPTRAGLTCRRHQALRLEHACRRGGRIAKPHNAASTVRLATSSTVASPSAVASNEIETLPSSSALDTPVAITVRLPLTVAASSACNSSFDAT